MSKNFTARLTLVLVATYGSTITAVVAQPARTEFKVTYAAANVVHLDAGSNDGLSEGVELEVARLEPGRPVSEAREGVGIVRVLSTKPTSAVGEVLVNFRGVAIGDLALAPAVRFREAKSMKPARDRKIQPRPRTPSPQTPRTDFRITYVAADTVYVDGGSEEGLSEGMELEVKRLEPGQPLTERKSVGTVRVIATAPNSAVCEIDINFGGIARDDQAYLSVADAENVAHLLTSKNSRNYPQVVSFSDYVDGNPLEDEQRAYVPRPPLAEINRAKGRISMQRSSLFDRTSGTASHQTGGAIRADVTRIGGTYWNFRGHWRGRANSRLRNQETLTDLINRTYHLELTYESPHSKNTVGAGRLLLPWASSLSTLDGGYFGRRVARSTTVGVFGGSTPDPTAWNYDPNRQILGVFSSFETGSFEKVRYTGTVGAAHTRRSWRPERQFAFVENTVSVNRRFSLYHNAELDHRSRGRFGSDKSGPVLSRNFLTVRAEANDYVTFDVSHNYFRGVPTFDSRLIGTGLVDQLLFQGVTGGVRIKLPQRSAVYGQLGRNDRRGDTQASSNYLLGYTWGNVPFLHVRADFRTSRFSSSFGSGRYHAVSLTRELTEDFRVQVQGGQQQFIGNLTNGSRARFIDMSLEWSLGMHYFLGLGSTVYRGDVQRYDQIFLDLGYRF